MVVVARLKKLTTVVTRKEKIILQNQPKIANFLPLTQKHPPKNAHKNVSFPL